MDARDWTDLHTLLNEGAKHAKFDNTWPLEAMAAKALELSEFYTGEEEFAQREQREIAEDDTGVLELTLQLLEERVNSLNTVIVSQGKRIRALEARLADKEG